MIPPIPVQLYVTVAAATELTNRRAKNLDGDSSSDTLAAFLNSQEKEFKQMRLSDDFTANPEDDQDLGIYSPFRK